MPPPMARDERVAGSWSQPRRTPLSKGRSGYVSAPGSGDLDDIGDIMSLLSNCNRSKGRKDAWPIHSRNSGSSRSFASARDCCLKNGRIHCSCLWSKSDFSMDRHSTCRNNFRKFSVERDPVMAHERKGTFCHESSNSSCIGGNKAVEEYVLDDNELCFDFYDMPFDIPKRHQVRKVGKVKTVSIIDTLSELASGATDREDEGCFSSAVSESAVLGRNPYHRAKHGRYSSSRRGHADKQNYLMSTPLCDNFSSKMVQRPQVNDSLNSYHESICNSQIKNFHGDDSSFTCSSLKRTLKYLRKAVSSNVVEEEPRTRRYARRHEEKDAFRQCFSDSEVREVPKPWSPVKREKPELNSRTKSRSLLTVTTQSPPESTGKKCHEEVLPRSHIRPKAETPDWIKKAFSAARKGEIEKLKNGLKDVDSALMRNLSDDHGNNLWHICAAQNHIQCLDWLCSRGSQQTEALKDENKHGFTPVALAVKHGSLLAVQWLIHNTISRSQLTPSGGSRSLLHVAAKYGQETSVQWLLSYMNSQDMNINGLDSEGNTALHLAAKHGHINCVKALIFQNGNMKARNERGLKPLNLAVKYSQENCADYLLAMESCYNLAAANLKQQSELLQLQKENAEIKSYFKELLTLTKRLQHRQRELVQSFTRNDSGGQFDLGIEKSAGKQHAKYVDDYSQILSSVVTDEEHRLKLIEDKWKKSRKQPKSLDTKKAPLDVIRLQFTHILSKVSDQSPAVPSTPETSDDCWQSGEEDISSSASVSVPASNTFSSAPDVIHSLPNQNVPFMNTKNIQTSGHKSTSSCSTKQKDIPENIHCNISSSSLKSSSETKTAACGGGRDVNLQMFFKQNPNLRQTSETCSVLEVLEPSSSDSDECMSTKQQLMKSITTEEELGQSSSSSAAETMSPSSCGPSSSGSKKSGSRSSSNGSRLDVGGGKGNNMPSVFISGCTSGSVGEEGGNRNCGDKGNNSGTSDSLNKDSSHINTFDSSVEPDLIKGTQKKKRSLPAFNTERNETGKERPPDANFTDNPSISTEDSESLEADRSFCSAIDVPEAMLSSQVMPDSSVTGTGVKKKSFLLKFALKSRWPAKPRTRSSKNEISAEEFRETYSRSSEHSQSASQCFSSSVAFTKKFPTSSLKDSEKAPETLSGAESGPSTAAHGLDSGMTCDVPSSCGDILHSSPQHIPSGLLPPRRDPPPVPPRPPRDKESSQLLSHDDMHVNVENSLSSSVASCLTGSAVSLQSPYMSTSTSNIWQSKPLFRPASSASRVESPTRADDNFPLNKSSSASTEMLSALDSSTAGRQSPAPSEVSKTESALSPPSDVSKTESTRYLSQLGRIEESGHLAALKATALQKIEDKNIESCDVKEEKNETKPKKKSGSSKKHGADKPWYEFSDEEDVITPQRYEVMSGRMRSSSEDEEITAS